MSHLSVSSRLIHWAARRAPAELSERLEEEWQADLATRGSTAARLRFALGCCWATRVIAREHMAPIPAAGAALGAKLAFLHHGNETRLLSRRSIALVVVVCLHVAVFYALLSGLGYNMTKTIPTDIQSRIIDAPRPHDILPPLPTPPLTKLALPQQLIVPPLDLPSMEEAQRDIDVAPPPTDVSPTLESPPGQTHEASARTASRVQGGPGSGFPNPDAYYPMVARHLAEEGMATVRVCVATNGRLTSEPTVVESTGNARLDAGALHLARAGSGHYRPTVEDGRPVDSCYAFRVRFQLKN